ncbi:MAG: FG-GAP repeat protein [Sandaracinaceae bacterium]|nr:FG-GAP repeat protein [Sandaracinaceae bacterium]
MLLADAGGVRARYAELWVEDAAGAVVPSRLEVRGGQVHLRVEDERARYPLLIDPLVATEQAKLEASDGAANDQLGWSVALDGDTALVAAVHDDTSGGTDAGSAYVFVRSGTAWTQQAKLEASDGAASDYFGISVALDGDTALVGARADDTSGGTNAGSAYVFVRSGTTWTAQTKLEASDGAAGDAFGYSVALDGDSALVGAPYDDTSRGTNAGSAYLFVRSGTTWTRQARLEAGDGAAEDRFGISVALDGDTALAGAEYGDHLARRERRLGLRLRAQRHDVDPAGEARGQRRRDVRHLRRLGRAGRAQRAGGRVRGRHLGRHGGRLGLRVRA